jgi:hypothetical protein
MQAFTCSQCGLIVLSVLRRSSYFTAFPHSHYLNGTNDKLLLHATTMCFVATYTLWLHFQFLRVTWIGSYGQQNLENTEFVPQALHARLCVGVWCLGWKLALQSHFITVIDLRFEEVRFASSLCMPLFCIRFHALGRMCCFCECFWIWQCVYLAFLQLSTQLPTKCTT